jgi:hypothetical protein
VRILTAHPTKRLIEMRPNGFLYLANRVKENGFELREF